MQYEKHFFLDKIRSLVIIHIAKTTVIFFNFINNLDIK